MPLYTHCIFEDGGIAIWHIEESTEVLYALLGTTRYDDALATISHEARRAEWLAVRVLIAQLLGADKEVLYQTSGRPYLADGSYHISISHTKGYAAIAYHRSSPIGVDVEQIASRVERIAFRFTHPDEAAYIDGCDTKRRLMYWVINWSAKETLYKVSNNSAAAEFREAFRIAPYELSQLGTLDVQCFACTEDALPMCVYYRVFPDIVCTWVVVSDEVN
jgi:phosphopantetheinyl transferase